MKSDNDTRSIGDSTRGNARNRNSLPLRVRDAHAVLTLASEIALHIMDHHLEKQGLEDLMAELIEIANDYGFHGGEQDEEDDPDIGLGE